LILISTILYLTVDHESTFSFEATGILILLFLRASVKVFQEITNDYKIRTHSRNPANVSNVNIIRDSTRISISKRALVVGDILIIEPGMTLPTDTILFKAYHQVHCDESGITEALTPAIKIPDSDFLANSSEENPFMLFGSQVVQGNGLGLVCGVRPNSANKIFWNMEHDEKFDLRERATDLGIKILVFAEGFNDRYLLLLAGIFIGVTVWGFLGMILGGFEVGFGGVVRGLISNVLSMSCMLLVSFSEGLPDALLDGFCWTCGALAEGDIFVKDGTGVELMNNCDEICTGVTGVLTLGEMGIKKVYLPDQMLDTGDTDFCNETNTALLQEILEAVCINSGADPKNPTPVDSQIEVSLLEFAQKFDITQKGVRMGGDSLKIWEYSEHTGVSQVLYKRGNGERPCLYATGAPDKVLWECTHYKDPLLKEVRFMDEGYREMLQKTVVGQFGSQMLKAVAVSVKNVDMTEVDQR
jgi:Ca2+-transporting ATPase